MRWLTSLLGALGLAAVAFGQDVGTQIYSNPLTPPREVLDRLNLQLGWRTYLPVQGRRDGLFTIQFEDNELFIQTQVGLIVKLDPETGRELWRTIVGTAFKPTHSLGFNKTMVFVVNGTWVYALDRATGRKLWEFNLPSAPSAPPVGDELQVYLSLGAGHIYTYQIVNAMPGTDKQADKPPDKPGDAPTLPPSAPRPEKKPAYGDPYAPRPTIFDRGARTLESLPQSGSVAQHFLGYQGPQPLILRADKVTAHFLEEVPLQASDRLLFPCADGGALSVSKLRPEELFFYPTKGAVTAAAGQHGETAYIASHDHDLTALSMTSGKALWRFSGPAPILRKPEVTDEDVYVVPERSGLYRINRATGDLVWRNTAAERFLSANKKFVYAVDRSGRLMVLDKARGTTLSGYDTRDFVVAIANEATDRFYLAAHNGLMVCLHDREYAKPLITKYAPPPKPAGKPPEMPPEKPPEKPPMDGDKQNP